MAIISTITSITVAETKRLVLPSTVDFPSVMLISCSLLVSSFILLATGVIPVSAVLASSV
jgi:hypothetical protein